MKVFLKKNLYQWSRHGHCWSTDGNHRMRVMEVYGWPEFLGYALAAMLLMIAFEMIFYLAFFGLKGGRGERILCLIFAALATIALWSAGSTNYENDARIEIIGVDKSLPIMFALMILIGNVWGGFVRFYTNRAVPVYIVWRVLGGVLALIVMVGIILIFNQAITNTVDTYFP